MRDTSFFTESWRVKSWAVLRAVCIITCAAAGLVGGQVAAPIEVSLEEGLIARLETTFRKHDDGDVLKSHARVLSVSKASVRDFSASLHYFYDGSQTADTLPLLRGPGWALTLVAGKDVRLEIEPPSGKPLVLTVPLLEKRPSTPERHHIAFSVRRDARQALTGLWVDGVERASAALAPGSLPLGADSVTAGHEILRGVLFEVRLYDRALSRPEILELAQWQPEPPAARPKSMYSFEMEKDEVLAVIGGSEAVVVMEEGSFEALLMRAYAAQRPRVRSLAWEADTVFRQDRPLNFGSLPLQLRRCEATCVLLMFGRQECLERGEEGVADFEAACERVIAQVKGVTPRLVIVEAAPFEKKAPPLPDLTPKNAALALYNEALRRLAEKHGAFFADSRESWHHARPQPLTRDGVNLTEAGARELGLRVQTSTSALEHPESAALLAAVREKNRLWHHYWRPDNWAFLHGDRTAQPSSRDHLNPQLRWFPAELERYRALIAEKEQEIWKLAQPPKVP